MITLSDQLLILLVATFVAWFTARLFAKKLAVEMPVKAIGGLVIDALFWGIIAARVGFILIWWQDYVAEPITMLAIGDGGFLWWLGVITATVYVLWKTRAQPYFRQSVFSGMMVGVVAWFATGFLLQQLQRTAPSLPELQLFTLEQQATVDLSSYKGRPIVLNLWASWCPPCRGEMPEFERAQKAFPQVAFVMVNQGETEKTVSAFLQQEALQLHDVLLDPSMKTMQVMRAAGLPVTLYFDEEGNQVESHLGAITLPGLKAALKRHFKIDSE